MISLEPRKFGVEGVDVHVVDRLLCRRFEMAFHRHSQSIFAHQNLTRLRLALVQHHLHELRVVPDGSEQASATHIDLDIFRPERGWRYFAA